MFNEDLILNYRELVAKFYGLFYFSPILYGYSIIEYIKYIR